MSSSSNFTPGKGSAQAAGKLRRPPPGGVEREPVPRRSESAQLLVEKKDAIEDVTTDILKSGLPIMRAQQVQLSVAEQRGLEVSTKLVRAVFRQELLVVATRRELHLAVSRARIE